MNLIPQFNFTDSVEGIIKNLYLKKKNLPGNINFNIF